VAVRACSAVAIALIALSVHPVVATKSADIVAVVKHASIAALATDAAGTIYGLGVTGSKDAASRD
jgi:hypothetical protein